MSAPAVSERVIFDVAGMDCADCAKSVERVVATLPGVSAATVSFGTGTLSVQSVDGESSLSDLARAVSGAVDRAGYTATMRAEGEFRAVAQTPWWQNRKLIPTAIASVLWLIAFTLLHGL